MTPDVVFWTAIGSGAAVFTLGALLLAHIIRYAYAQGGFNQRLITLETHQQATAGIQEVVAGLTATVSGLTRAVDRLDRATERLDSHQRRGEV